MKTVPLCLISDDGISYKSHTFHNEVAV